MKAWYGTREAIKCWRNEFADTLIKEGNKPVVVDPMMLVSERHGYVTVCNGDLFEPSGSAAALDEVDRVLTRQFDTKNLAAHWTDGVWWRGDGWLAPGQKNQVEPSRFRMGVKQHCAD